MSSLPQLAEMPSEEWMSDNMINSQFLASMYKHGSDAMDMSNISDLIDKSTF